MTAPPIHRRRVQLSASMHLRRSKADGPQPILSWHQPPDRLLRTRLGHGQRRSAEPVPLRARSDRHPDRSRTSTGNSKGDLVAWRGAVGDRKDPSGWPVGKPDLEPVEIAPLTIRGNLDGHARATAAENVLPSHDTVSRRPYIEEVR